MSSLNKPGKSVTYSTNPATVRYDTERSASSVDGLAPPDLDALEKRKTIWNRLKHWELPRRVQLPLTCTCIALSALQANGVYCWPTYGPVVAQILELDGAEAQTIVVGGILGVYLMAAPLGSICDRYGVRFGSFLSAILSATGYAAFSIILTHATPTTPHVYIYLTAAYFCVGMATVGTYFACLTCASLSFPSLPTLSLSLPLSLVGLSSLFISSFSTLSIFQTTDVSGERDLDPVKFLRFLAILCPIINLFSAMFMRVLPEPPLSVKQPRIRSSGGQSEQDDMSDDSEDEDVNEHAEWRMSMSQSLHLDERTPLLIGGIEAAMEEAEAIDKGKGVKWTAWGLVKDWEGFWFFGIILALCIGPSETIIASVGSILTSLLPPTFAPLSPSSLAMMSPITSHGSSALSLRNKHVRILSLSSTVSRLFTGVLADYLCPPAVAVPAPRSNDPDAPSHLFVRKRPIILSRAMFAALCSAILAAIYAWSAGMLESEAGLWVLSGGVGTFYGALFTLSPAIVSAHFGPTNFGLAWGMVSYFSALGSVLFSYLYALLSQAVAEEGQEPVSPVISTLVKSTSPVLTCYGTKCFEPSLWVATACAILSSIGFVVIARMWKT